MNSATRRCLGNLVRLSTPLLGLALAASSTAAQTWAFRHVAAVTFLDTTTIDHPEINDKPDLVVIVSQLWSPAGGVFGIANDHNVGLSYNSSTGRWSIYNEDFALMPEGAAFNVLAATTGLVNPVAFVHTTTAGNTFGDSTFLSDPRLTVCPSARLHVTHYRNPGGGSGPRNDHPLSVEYDSFSDLWTIRNRDEASLPIGASFNVLLTRFCLSLSSRSRATSIAQGEHIAEVGNTTGSLTRFHREFTTGHPEAMVFATVDSSPPAALDPHPIGVIYDPFTTQWGIFNEGGADMPSGTEFNLYVPDELILFEDGFESGDLSEWSL